MQSLCLRVRRQFPALGPFTQNLGHAPIFYNYGAATDFHTWIPTDAELDWLSSKYPDTFDRLYRPRYEYWRKLQKEGKRFYNTTLPMLCQTCQIPMLFTEPDDPTKICYRETEYGGDKYHFCSDGCKDVFLGEPEKYVQAWLPVHQILQGNCFGADANPAAPGFEPLSEVLKWYHIQVGQDNFDFEDSQDCANWKKWKDLGSADSPTSTSNAEQKAA